MVLGRVIVVIGLAVVTVAFGYASVSLWVSPSVVVGIPIMVGESVVGVVAASVVGIDVMLPIKSKTGNICYEQRQY